MADSEQALRPSTSKPERGTDRWFGVVIVAATGTLLGGIAVMAIRAGDSEPPAPPACLEALDAADDLIDAATDALGLTAEAFEAISELDIDRVEDVARRLEDGTPEVRGLRAAYDDAAEECRG